jgi:DNA polymerase-3 subunit delta'
MTPDASNAFLKTLEEPAPSTILILITAAEERIPETVRSRCRRVAFHGVPRAAIERALIERWDAAPEEAATLAALAQGRLGWAVEALQDGRVLAERDRILDDIESVMAGNVAARFTYAANLGSRYSRDANAVRASLDIWSNWWRDVLVTAAGQESALMNPSRLDTLRAQAAQYGVKGALDALRAITAGSKHLEERASPTLAMEAMLLELPLPQARP